MTTEIKGTAFVLCNNSKQAQAIVRMGQFEFERKPQIIVLTNGSVDKMRGLRNVNLIMGQLPALNITHDEEFLKFKFLLRDLRESKGCTVHWADL